jgi:hypothetical protein
MDRSDVRLFFKIQKQRRFARRATILIFCFVFANAALMLTTGIDYTWVTPIVWGSVGGAVVCVALQYIHTPEEVLAEIIERQINAEVDTLRYFSDVQRRTDHAPAAKPI